MSRAIPTHVNSPYEAGRSHATIFPQVDLFILDNVEIQTEIQKGWCIYIYIYMYTESPVWEAWSTLTFSSEGSSLERNVMFFQISL